MKTATQQRTPAVKTSPIVSPARSLHTPVPATRVRANSREQFPNPRVRLNSREIARSYSGQYVPDVSVLKTKTQSPHNSTIFIVSYLSLVVVLHIFVMTVADPTTALTWTNFVHMLMTMLHLHWFKGNMLDEQGELSAMTLWEQFEAADAVNIKVALCVVPSALAYFACQTAHFHPRISLMNTLIWVITITGKLPFMDGVRIFGINRTVGIDDSD